MSDKELRSTLINIVLTHGNSPTRDIEIRKVCTAIRQDLESLHSQLCSMLSTQELHDLGQHSMEHRCIANELNFTEGALSEIPASCRECHPSCLREVLLIVRRLRYTVKVCQNPPFRRMPRRDPLDSLIASIIRDLHPYLSDQRKRKPMLVPTLKAAESKQYLKNHGNWRYVKLYLNTERNAWVRCYECDLPQSILTTVCRPVIRGEVDYDGCVIVIEIGERFSPPCDKSVWWTTTIRPANDSD